MYFFAFNSIFYHPKESNGNEVGLIFHCALHSLIGMSSAGHVDGADSVCEMKPSGLYNGLRLNRYWTLLLCLFVLATTSYPNPQAKLDEQLFIWLQIPYLHPSEDRF